jgi:hypothetical protein
MIGWLAWFTNIGVPTLSGIACFLVAAAAYAYIPKIPWLPDIRTPVCAALVAGGVWFIAYAEGAKSTNAACQEAAVRAELATVRADLATAKAAADRAREFGDRLAAAEARNAEVIHELETRPIPDACRLSDDDRRRLLGIR